MHTSIVSQWILYVNSDLCIYGKVPREYLFIYILYLSPRPYAAPPCRLFPSPLFLYMPLFHALMRSVPPVRLYMGHTHVAIYRRIQSLTMAYCYLPILYHNSLYITRHITLLFIYLKIKKKIYRNAKNEKKSTEKIKDGVIPYPLRKVVALFCPEKHNIFYGVIFTRTKREQNNTIKIWYNMPITHKLTRSHPIPPDPHHNHKVIHRLTSVIDRLISFY